LGVCLQEFMTAKEASNLVTGSARNEADVNRVVDRFCDMMSFDQGSILSKLF
jgi:hypothetical protein